MNWQAIVHWLIPKEDHFYTFLEEQAAKADEAATALCRFRDGDGAEAVRDAVQELEHEGDKIAHAMMDALAKTFVTPLDREDLQRLSVELDDILDLANGAIRAAVLYGVERPTGAMQAQIGILVQCTELIRTIIPKLRSHAYTEITRDSTRLRALEKEGDTIYRNAIRDLFRNPDVDAKELFRQKQVLEILENAIDRCEILAKTLSNLAVKHG